MRLVLPLGFLLLGCTPGPGTVAASPVCGGESAGTPVDAGTFFADEDGDGYGDPAGVATGCEAPVGYVANNTDCDDGDSAVHPDAAEADCTDPVDYNCDGASMYADADGDGAPACEDCDDADASRSPLLVERCDEANLDEDCSGNADDADAGTDVASMSEWFLDADADGYGDVASRLALCDVPEGYVADATDCDDTRADRSPGQTEVCDDANTDEDCDGAADDADASAVGQTVTYTDSDVDGYGDALTAAALCDPAAGSVANGDDCDDTRGDVSPAAAERCDAADTDEDCDGAAEDDDPSVDVASMTAWYADVDADGYGDSASFSVQCDSPSAFVAADGDCDDTDAAVSPIATETCATDYDDDCDGGANDAGATGCSDWYYDGDSDGYGVSMVSQCTCVAEGFYALAGVTSATEDCDDASVDVSPAAAEVCGNAIDDNCDGAVDEGCPTYAYSGDYDAEYTSTASTDADAMIYGSATNDYFGETLISGVDFDGDGYDNFVVGATGNQYRYGSQEGSLYMYDGFPTGSADAATSDLALLYNSQYGRTYPLQLYGIEDFDGDGYDELAAVDYYTSAYKDHYFWLYEGEDLSGTADAGTCFDYDWYSGPVSGAGAADSTSGTNDLMVGDTQWYSKGMVSLYAYKSSGLTSRIQIDGEDSSDYAGHGLAGGSHNDTNGDGYDDLFIGAYGDDTTGSEAGAAYVVETPLTTTFDLSSAQVKIAGGAASDRFGWWVGAPGDVNGDGKADLLASAPYGDDGGTDAGVVHLFENVDTDGSSPDNAVADAVASVVGEYSLDYLGYYDVVTGDVNGDGETDIVLGSPTWDAPATSTAGAAWLIYGPLSGTYDLGVTADYDARFLGDDTDDACGSAVALGDLDADGAEDILMGCKRGDSGSYTDRGTVYIFAGG